MQEMWVWHLDWEDPLEKEWWPTPVFLPGKSHGERNWANYSTAAVAKSHQPCPTLCDSMDSSPPGSRPGIFQARILEWAAISLSSAWKWKVKVKSFSPVWHFATPWTVASVQLCVTAWTAAHQAPVHGILQARVLEWGAIATVHRVAKES